MYYNISSMQNMSKLLQCTHAHTRRNEAFVLKSQSLFSSFPRGSSSASSLTVRLLASQHHCQRHRVCLPCRVWISEVMTGKGSSRQSSNRRLPERAALQQTWTARECQSQAQEPEHRQITMTEFNIFPEAFVISTGT